MTRIVCVGITVLDRIWYLDDLPKEGGKYVAKDYTEVGGGPAATAAVAAAKLGAEVDFIGRVGDDDTGRRLLAELESLGVNTRYTRIVKGARSSQSAVLVDAGGERVIANYPSPDLPAAADWLHEIDFSQWDIVLADADVTPQDIADLIALSDHAAFSAPGLRRLTQRDETENALKKAQTLTNGHVYVTQGRDGCFWLENGALCHQPGFEVNVVDTTGAGDVFHGALAVSLGQQSSTSDAVRFASAVAALKCTKPGGRAGIPDCDQTRSFLSLFV